MEPKIRIPNQALKYDQYLHTQRNSSTSWYYATCVLKGYSSRNTTHTVLAKLKAWPWNKTYQPRKILQATNRVSMKPLIFLHPKACRSLTMSHLHRGWLSQECRLEIKFYTKGWSVQHNQKTGRQYPRKCWDTLIAPIMQGFLNVNSVEPSTAPQKQRKMVTSQMRLMITNKRQFSWSSIYRIHWPTPMLNAKCSWLQHNHKCQVYAHKWKLSQKQG